jgi:hypothetical protein
MHKGVNWMMSISTSASTRGRMLRKTCSRFMANKPTSVSKEKPSSSLLPGICW